MLDKIYYLNVGKGGTFEKSGDYHTEPADVDALIKYLEAKDTDRLLVYFHGGLVSEKSGMAAAKIMRDSFEDLPGRTHAVTFVWETGPFETVKQNLGGLSELINNDFFQKALNFVIKLAGKKLGIDSRGGGETMDYATIASEKSKEAPFADMDQELGSKGGGVYFDEEDEAAYEAQIKEESKILVLQESEENPDFEMPQEAEGDSKGLFEIIAVVGKITFAVLKRYHKQTHHDFYPTIVEEAFRVIYLDKIGQWGWSAMKDKAADMFADNTAREGHQQYVGSYFLSALQAHYQKRTQSGKKFSIELLGHSAGSIALCHLLKTTSSRHNGLHFNNMVFLAPACRTDLFTTTAIPALNNGIFKKFRMYTMDESYEKKDHCIPYLYTYSLLYLVSGLFEDETDAKIMGLHEQLKADGRYADFAELQTLKNFMANHILALSINTTATDQSVWTDAVKHGDFDNNKHTLGSILKTINLS